jgi:hypothetical protein
LPCPFPYISIGQVDPFFVPTTEEEREEHGEDASGLTNLARRLIDAVRRRKVRRDPEGQTLATRGEVLGVKTH